MKLQEEVDGDKTVNNPPVQLLTWVIDSSEISRSTNHYLHKSLEPKPLLVLAC